jgi:hypothetical protein
MDYKMSWNAAQHEPLVRSLGLSNQLQPRRDNKVYCFFRFLFQNRKPMRVMCAKTNCLQSYDRNGTEVY